jgi:hypothetical protein
MTASYTHEPEGNPIIGGAVFIAFLFVIIYCVAVLVDGMIKLIGWCL